MNTEGHLKGRTNQYALHLLSGPIKEALWAGLASCRLVANIEPAERPNPRRDDTVDSRERGRSFDGKTPHTHIVNHLIHGIMGLIMNLYRHQTE